MINVTRGVAVQARCIDLIRISCYQRLVLGTLTDVHLYKPACAVHPHKLLSFSPLHMPLIGLHTHVPRGAIEASHGYVLVNALPGQVMPKPPGEPAAEGMCMNASASLKWVVLSRTDLHQNIASMRLCKAVMQQYMLQDTTPVRHPSSEPCMSAPRCAQCVHLCPYLAGQKQPSSHDSAAPQDQQLASTDAAPPKAPPSTQPPPAAESEEQQQQSSTQPLAAAESQEQQQQRQPSGPPPLPAEGFSDGFGDDAFVMVGAQDVGGAQAGSAQGALCRSRCRDWCSAVLRVSDVTCLDDRSIV